MNTENEKERIESFIYVLKEKRDGKQLSIWRSVLRMTLKELDDLWAEIYLLELQDGGGMDKIQIDEIIKKLELFQEIGSRSYAFYRLNAYLQLELWRKRPDLKDDYLRKLAEYNPNMRSNTRGRKTKRGSNWL